MLEEIPFVGHATTKSWKRIRALAGPRIMAHPGRNRPEVLRWLIERHSPEGGTVYDPMAGVGTVLFESSFLSRRAVGWDLDPNCRVFWREDWICESPVPESVDLVITSPPYFEANHAPGKGAKQEAYSAEIGSAAGSAWEFDHPLNLGQIKSTSIYTAVLHSVYNKAYRALKPGGIFILIVRNRIHKGKQNQFKDMNLDLMQLVGLELLGAHPRKMRPAARHYQRRKQQPDQPWVQEELALIGRRSGV